jgi:Transcription factor WhiB/Lsr2
VSAPRWEDRAACLGWDTDLWFPAVGGAVPGELPRRVCRSCPVQNECLDDALSTETAAYRHGIRAGLTPAERGAIADGERPRPDLTPGPEPPPQPPTPQRPIPQPLQPPRPKGVSVSVTDITPPPTPRLDPRDIQPATAEALIAWGAAHPTARVQGLASKARAALHELRQESERSAAVAEAEARVQRLEAQLANARRDLASAKGTSKTKGTSGGGARPDTDEMRAIRKWAAANGHQVAPKGLIARTVIDAYRAAQQAVPQAQAS